MVALFRSFVVLLLSSITLAKFGNHHPHGKTAAIQKRGSARGAKRDVCKKAPKPVDEKAVPSGLNNTSSNSATSSGTAASDKASSGGSTSSGATTFTPSHPSSGGAWWHSNSGNYNKIVVAHFIVGNAYSYSPSQWQKEIKMASAQGIDAFALNIGYDSWQPGQVKAAYDAASATGTGFKMFISLDMTVLSCSDNAVITKNIADYKDHPAQLKDSKGAVLLSTFDGGNCKSSQDWANAFSAAGTAVRFFPAFFNDLTSTTLKSTYPVIGGDLIWGAGWPKENTPIDWSEDQYRISRDGINRAAGDLYVTTVAPWFFAHYSGKNMIWHFDDFLYASRWEDLFNHRNDVDIVEIVSWNDYGESTYIGPIGADQPGSQAWVNGFDHAAWLEMTGYYTTAFKTGVWPSITADKIFIWGRPHGVNDNAPDGVGRPDRYTWATDKLQAVLFSTGAGSLTITQGSSSTTTQVKAGVNKISLDLGAAQGVTAVLTRGGSQVFSFSAPISFGHSPSSYNFNANTASGP